MPNLAAPYPTQAAMGFSMRQYPVGSNYYVLASLSANATQQLGDAAISWLCTLVACVPLLLLLLHAVRTTTARTGHGFASTATGSWASLRSCRRRRHSLLLSAALVLGVPNGLAAAEYTSCERPIGQWVAIDQVRRVLRAAPCMHSHVAVQIPCNSAAPAPCSYRGTGRLISEM